MKNVLKIVVDASLKAGACILGYYKSEYEIKEKGYHNPVTTADHAANDKLKKILLNIKIYAQILKKQLRVFMIFWIFLIIKNIKKKLPLKISCKKNL